VTIPELRVHRHRVIVGLLALILMLGGCGSAPGGGEGPGSPADPDGSPSPKPASVSVSADRWIAVIATGDLADDLDEEAGAVRQALGPAMVVSPVACLEGLPAEAGSGYVLGAVGSSEQEATEAVENAERAPLFVVPVTVVCID
jgi:hypothetical protein